MGRSKLSPRDLVNLAASEGVKISEPTLATWRSRDPGRLPFLKIGGRVYYEREIAERFLQIPPDADLAGG